MKSKLLLLLSLGAASFALAGDVTLPAGGYMPQDSDNASVIAQRQAAAIAALDTKTPAKGQATSANSQPVVIASDQSSVPTTATLAQITTTAFRNTAVSSTPVQVKASGGSIYGFNLINPNSTAVYVKLYDALAVNVTVGTTTPTDTIFLPANGAFRFPKNGYAHGTYAAGITVAAVTGIADNSSTAPTTGVYVALGYQ